MYGEISAKAGARHGVGVKGTKVNPKFGAKEEPFHGKHGKADQGKAHNRGIPEATTRMINNSRQGAGRPSHAGGMPSRGGRVGRGGQPDVDHIDQEQIDHLVRSIR